MTLDKRKELLTKAKSIRFDTEMVRAILDGRKTVTRRAIKPQPIAKIAYCSGGSGAGKWMYPGDMVCEPWEDESYRLPSDITQEELCRKWTPPCNTDDILYVRETWCKGSLNYGIEQYYYKADDKIEHCRWEPSTRMPKEAARIFLKVTNVSVERLQDINDEEALKEGYGYFGAVDWMKEPLPDFRDTWNSAVKKKDLGKYGWDANPWVWVVEFERVD